MKVSDYLQEIIELRKAKKSYEQISQTIAEHLNRPKLSRERIRQVLALYAPELTGRELSPEKRMESVTCTCGVVFEAPVFQHRKYHNQTCASNARRKYPKGFFKTPEYKKILHERYIKRKREHPEVFQRYAQRAHAKYKHRLRTDPAFLEKERAYHREWQRKRLARKQEEQT